MTSKEREAATIIVIPTYNEAGNMPLLIDAIFKAVPDVRVLIVDDNSPDGTADIVAKLQQTYPRLILYKRAGKEGLGVAYRAGFKKVIAEYPETEVVMMMDADFYHDPRDLPRIITASLDYDMVIGSVYATGGKVPDSFTFARRFLSRGGNLYCRLFFGYPLTDWTNAFVAIRMSVLRRIDLDALAAKEFAFVFGIKYALLRAGATWKDVGVVAIERSIGESKVTLRTIREALLAPLKLRFSSRS